MNACLHKKEFTSERESERRRGGDHPPLADARDTDPPAKAREKL